MSDSIEKHPECTRPQKRLADGREKIWSSLSSEMLKKYGWQVYSGTCNVMFILKMFKTQYIFSLSLSFGHSSTFVLLVTILIKSYLGAQ